jgi:hypothetical protein
MRTDPAAPATDQPLTGAAPATDQPLTGAATITPTDATTATTRTAVDEELSHAPSELMRFGYTFMGAGLGIIK